MDSRLSRPAYSQTSALAVQAVEGMPLFGAGGCGGLGTAASPLGFGKSLRAKASFYAAVSGRCRAGIYGKRVSRRGGSSVFLDIGANAGVYTLWTASLGLDVRIESFEPDPELCERLQANLNRNNIEKTRLHSIALGNPQKLYALLRNERNRGRNRLVDARHCKGIAVPVRPLWEILQELNIGRVDVLKIDVEGHEAEILLPFFSQSPKSLWPKSVICELPRKGRDWRNCRVVSLLEERQYTLLQQTRMNGIFQRPAEKEDG